MNPLLIIGGLGAVALYLWSQSSSGSASMTPAQAAAANAGLIAANAQLANAQTPGAYNAANPSTYGGVGTPSTAVPPDWGPPVAAAAASGASPVANNAPPGAPTGATTSAGAPLFHTGYSDANSGAVIATDGYGTGNPYLV